MDDCGRFQDSYRRIQTLVFFFQFIFGFIYGLDQVLTFKLEGNGLLEFRFNNDFFVKIL